jgi:hypothetical protein
VIQNRSTSTTYRLSWPYAGRNVATLATWTSKADVDGVFGELTQGLYINAGHYSDPRLVLAGKPLLIGPGETLQRDVALNVHQFRYFDAASSVAAWRPGIGFKEPGVYNLYVQYVNLDAIYIAPSESPSAHYPFEPLVFGPFEVRISSPIGEASHLVEYISEWESMCSATDRLVDIDSRHFERIIRDLRQREAPAELVESLVLTLHTEKLLGCTRGKASPESHAKVNELLDDLRLWRTYSEEIYKEQSVLAECYALVHMDRVEEALKLCRELSSPDAITLAAQLTQELHGHDEPPSVE